MGTHRAVMNQRSVSLHRAKISTLGSHAEDVFWISGTILACPQETKAFLS